MVASAQLDMRALVFGAFTLLSLPLVTTAVWLAALQGEAPGVMLVGGALLLAGGAASLLLRALRSLERVTALVERVQEQGDLSLRVDAAEAGRMAAALNGVLERLGRFTGETVRAVSGVAQAAGQVIAVSDRTEKGVAQQNRDLAGVAAAMNEMTVSVEEVSRHAALAAEAAETTDCEAQAGRTLLDETSSALYALVARIESGAQVIARLEGECAQVGQVLEVIGQITSRTNLLALNASIEAARAGEHGRGFAVVAEEVRALAAQTQSSTSEIGAMIQRLQAEARAAVAAMEESRSQAQLTVKQTGRTSTALARIQEAVATIRNMNQEIASAVDEQNRAAEEMNDNVARIAQVAQENARAAHEMVHAGGHIGDEMERLRLLASAFRTADAGLDLSAARTAHLAWKARLRAFLDGTSELKRDQVVSHRDCALGKWFYAAGLAQYSGLPEMKALEAPHEELHRVIREVIEARNAGNLQQAEALFTRVEPLSRQIVDLLEAIERKAAAEGKQPAAPVRHAHGERAVGLKLQSA